MKRSIFAVGLLFGVALLRAAAATPDEEFEKTARAYIDGLLAGRPELATKAGDHRFDDRLRDYSAKNREQQLAEAKKCATALKQFGDGSKLSAANRVDVRILAENVDREIFELEELKEPDWNPMVYSESFGEALYPIVARDFGALEKRIASLRKRMEAIPRVIDQAKQNLQHPPRENTLAAIEQVRDSVALVRLGLDSLLDQTPAQKKEIASLQAATATALEGYMRWLGQDLLHRSENNFRLGQDKFRKKLRFTTGSDLSTEEILKRAKEDLSKTQTSMYETAVPLYKKYFPNATNDALTDKRKVIKAVLDKLAEQYPEPASIVGELQKATAEATDFVKQHNLVTMPATAVEVIIMPDFRRDGGLVTYCDAPGPLDKAGKTFFAIALPPATWPRPRQVSFYREYNNYMLRDLAAHETMPGCSLQLARANELHGPTVVRAVFPSRTFTEGWAAYSEQLMADSGYGGAEVKMQQLKMRLRFDCDAIVDQSVQAGEMNVQAAMNLMKFEGFQEEGQMVATWKRARLTSAQLSVPFVGMTQHLDLLEKAKAKSGMSFDVKKYNDQVTSFGSVPVKYVRELMGL